MSDQRIAVAVRIRPPLEKEKYSPVCARKASDGQTISIKLDDSSATAFVQQSNGGNGSNSFLFDYVFDEKDNQQGVYEESVQELVDHALSGFNATVFTYGQTGSGKTFTILGSTQEMKATQERFSTMRRESIGAFELSEGSGMFLRVFQDLFHYRESVQQKIKIMLSLSAIELYVDDVMDLLSKNKKKLKLRESPEETLMLGITLMEVKDMKDVLANYELANSFRSVTATKMNDTSSRSHALFFIDIFQIPETNPKTGKANPLFQQVPSFESLVGGDSNSNMDGIVRSRLALVDLAGSERVKKSGVTGQGMTEAQAINKSLSTLGTVINAMYTQQSHIPFRESKLTKLLKNSLIDTKSKLLLIGQVSPPLVSAEESLGTLRFCDRVKGLKAGQVSGFADPQEEENFLKSVKLDEELTAEMRILNAEHYFEPQRIVQRAEQQSIPLERVRQERIDYLRANAGQLNAQKEAQFLQQIEEEEARGRDAEVEQFVVHMNQLIEEYETVAHAVKKEKKRQKKLKEECEAEQEELLHEAKKYKKARVKLDEKVKQLRLELAQLRQAEEEIDGEAEGVASGRIAVGEGTSELAQEHKPTNPLMTGETESAIHELIENFHAHAMEQNRLYSMYVSRLHATGRQRAQVRHMKLMSSDIVTDGSLLSDIIYFLVERAVDISDGVVKADSRWQWRDVDGLSRQVLSADSLFPPLLPSSEELAARPATKPVTEKCHNITFLSSDESDGENSHHAAETRKARQAKGASSSLLMPEPEEEDHKKSHRSKKEKKSRAEEPEVEEEAAAPPKKDKKKKHAKPVVASSDDDEEERRHARKDGSDDEGSAKDAEESGSSVSGDSAADPVVEERKSEPTADLRQVYDSPDLVKNLLRFLRSGAVMIKHGRKGNPHDRIFWVNISRGDKQLLWRDTKFVNPNAKGVDRSSVPINSISYIQLGCFSKVFRRHYIPPTNPAFFRCFSVGLKKGGRTVDIVAKNVADMEAWVVGLSHLAGVDPEFGGKLDITREQGFESLTFFESSLCEANYIYPIQYLTLKKEVQRRAAETLKVLESTGNDRQKAFKILGGIHPPDIDQHGALYFTKGELRFLFKEFDLDIFRVTKIWLLFKQMGLVFDDHFTPITAFGVTRRE
ncbi:Microtubule binding/Kinesin motor domain containing protein, putative [Angomonas deanei]|uniref:Microtubule binding/Kinesin motor domain containing protein, putative n=1 Tax=Angomonas deanei TaxID=59799 RepID=A0A7G2CED4_9TRYP|nr:Microtubule binding/Kinesin motor domain containing protein, putative [Angomonas deanei]